MVVERGQPDSDAVAGEIGPDLAAAQPFGDQRRVGRGRVEPDAERAVQLVRRRQAVAGVARAAQRHPARDGPRRPRARRRLDGVAVRVAGARRGGTRGERARVEEAVGDRPMVDPPGCGQRQRIGRADARFGEAARDGVGPAGGAQLGEAVADVAGELLRSSGGLLDVGPEPQVERAEPRRADLDLAAGAERGRVELVRRRRRHRPRRIEADRRRREGRRVEIGERVVPPARAAGQADAAEEAGVVRHHPGHAARPPVVVGERVEAERRRPGRDDGADRDAVLVVRRADVGRAALGGGNDEIAVAAILARAHGDAAAGERHGDPRPRAERAIAAAVDLGAQVRNRAGIGAGQLDRARQRALAERPAPGAAGDADARQPVGGEREPRDIAGERVGDRGAVEQDQRARSRIAADRAQRRALAGRVGGAAVGAAELLEPGDGAEKVLDPPGGGRECAGGDRYRVIGDLARGPGERGDDDLRRQVGQHAPCPAEP